MTSECEEAEKMEKLEEETTVSPTQTAKVGLEGFSSHSEQPISRLDNLCYKERKFYKRFLQ